MNLDLLQTFVRYLLLALAGHLATRGYIDEGMADYLVSAGVAGTAIIWFMWTKKRKAEPPLPGDPDYSDGI